MPDGQKPSNDGAGGGNLPSGSGTRGCPIPGTGDYVINLTYDGHLTVHQVDQHMLVEELATEAAHAISDHLDVLWVYFRGHLTVHQVDQHMLVEELATEAAHVYVFPI